MERINLKLKFLLVLTVLAFSLNLVLLLNSNKETERIDRKVVRIAQEIDRLKFEISNINSRSGTNSESVESSSFNGSIMTMLQSRLSEMKKEIESLKNRSGESPALSEYREREERLWREHAEKVKEAWTANLVQSLSATGFNEVETEMITEDYNIMLDKIKEEQIRWYHGEVATDDLTRASEEYSKELFNNLSYSIGDQKASIVLGIIFPDPMVRKKILER
jgi:hypothetical protein